ncbi:MAG: carbon-nitrogen hydrolase family protein [Chloroflexia bacterium]
MVGRRPLGADAILPQLTLKIALAQIRCEKGDWAGNLERTDQYMERAAAAGCHVIIFPEMGLSGYCDPAKFPDSVQSLDSPWVARFVELSARHGIAASGGFIEANPHGKPFITQVLVQGGQIIGVYRKVHVVDEEAEWFSPGDQTPVFNLALPRPAADEGRGPSADDGRWTMDDGVVEPVSLPPSSIVHRPSSVTCALAVCADSDRPDLFAAFARAGARVVFHSSAPGLYGRRTDAASWQSGFDWYKSHLFERLPAYARDNSLYIAVATQTGATVDEDFPGGSFIFAPDGSCVAGVEGYEEVMVVHQIEIQRKT